MNEDQQAPEEIAVIGMSGRFPQAETPDEFWQNLIDGKDCISHFGDRTAADGSLFIGARGILEKPDLFDAAFFGIYPKEAELMDPQHRIFLECAWEAIEDGGYDPEQYAGMIGVYAGLSLNTYLLNNIGETQGLAENYQVSDYQKMLGNDKDFLPVRVSYKLNLRGPSMAIQTACSTSLVAICQAATALLTYQTDMAIAGGVSVSFPQERHYRFTEEGMVSPDGTCRAFDEKAAGTVFGHGCGVVLLKRLSEAIADGDPILAVIKGWSVNNDGSDKIGFAAPGLNAQADVIAQAQASAGVRPSEISYIEAHGTGTPLGDPIEVAALTKAFREGGATGNQFCAIGTGKTHIGHLDVAAGVTGLIKTIQQFRHQTIPPLLHFQSPNPHIDFSNSPFEPVASARAWPQGNTPRIAGVSAFGVGGTNAHIVVQEPPVPKATSPSAKPQILLISAKTESSLNASARRISHHLAKEKPVLADAAFTLATARRAFPVRRAVIASNIEEAVAKLDQSTTSIVVPAEKRRIAFLFPGQGSQYGEMTRAIYDAEPVFRAALDECANLLRDYLPSDIRSILYPSDYERENAIVQLARTEFTQPCIFAVEYSLAQLFISWGIQPSLLIGHSIGEYVAAVLAGTFTLADALQLIAARGRMMQELPGGSMLAVRAGFADLTLPEGIDLAAVNSEKLCTVSGPDEAINAFQQALEARDIASRKLETSHAFHSAAMESITGDFTTKAAEFTANAAAIPWISTCTGRLMDAETLANPGYWSRQLRQPVLFAGALATALASTDLILLEIGPGKALSQFARQHPLRNATQVIAALPSAENDLTDVYSALAELWTNGATVDWKSFYQTETRARIHLPTYAFDRESFWIDRSSNAAPIQEAAAEETTFTAEASSSIDVAAKLRSIVAELSGTSIEDDQATFTELGFDSLFLTQASQAVQSKFGVKITFRQMLGELSSIAAIAKHINEVAPPAPAAPLATRSTVVSTATTAPAGSSEIEQALHKQIQLIQGLLSQHRQQTPLETDAAASKLSAVKWPSQFSRSATTSNRFGPYKPIEKGENGGLTSLQQKSLEDLIARYVRKTPGSKSYTAEHRAHYADPRAVSGFKSLWKEMVYPIVSARSKDAKIWDIDGNEYVDITMGFGTYFFGHSPDWLVQALETQLKSGIEIGPQSPIAGKLAKAIAELTNMERVTFCNTGSEAVMAAMRLARTITGRDRIAYFTGDYHGMFEEVLVRGAWVDGVYKAQPIAPGIPQSLVENMLVLDYADPASLEILRAHAHELAAVMIEPVQSRAPGLQPRGFMQEVRAITREAGTALIFDEVVTGFRCSPGGAQAYFGVEADLATYGKVIGGGMPIGVLAGKREYMDALDGGAWNYGDDSFPEVGVTFFAGTFVRHPLALAAAWRVVEFLKGEGPRLQIEMEERVSRFCRTLNDHFTAIGVPIRIPHFSAYAVIEHAPELKYASLLWYYLRSKGIHVWEGRPLYFTTAHSDEDFDQIINAFVQAVAEMQTAGFFPASQSNEATRPNSFPRFDSAPTTEAQREIFHAVQMGDDANCSFNESNIIRFDGPLDLAALKTALNDIVVRHPALRSTLSADGATQFFHPSSRSMEIMEHNFASANGSHLPSPSSMLPLSLLKQAESSTPFDLTNGPLIRLHLVKLSTTRSELIFTAHHIICDGWSFGMIIAELATAYNSRKADRLPVLPPALSFADYARAEAAAGGSEERISAESFWVAKYQEAAPVLALPTDRPRSQNRNYHGAMETITLDPERYERLKKASPKLGGTLFATLLSSFATLLHRLTSQEDLVIGVPAAGQTRIGRDELIGHCLNFLPLRLKPAGTRHFKDFAQDVKEQVLEAYDHQDYTFGSLLQKIQVVRDSSRVPLVSVIFNIDKTGIDHVKFDDLQIDVATNPKQFVNFDLFFNLVQSDEKLLVECEYNTDLHDASTIRSWLESFEQLIESAIQNPEIPLRDMEIVSEADLEKLLLQWNATDAPLPSQSAIHRLIEMQTDLVPQAIALRANGRSFTYRDIDRHANALADFIRKNGVTRESLVGICAERRVETIVAILAVLKAGAAYVPIDPKYPAERIAYILKDSQARFVLTQRSLSGSYPTAAETTTLFIDDCLNFYGDRVSSDTQPSDLAYVIYTSGSTGHPKGVAIEHRNAAAFIGWAKSVYRPEELSGVLFSTSICFDLSIFEMFVTLACGGAMILAENALDLQNHPHRSQITLINTVPSAISELLDAKLVPPSVRVINLAGEALSTAIVDRIYATTNTEKVYDLYGPSEDTTYSTYTLRKRGAPASIGRPISNTQAYILDPDGKLAPPGVAGELHLGGAGLARGYLNRPELTAEKFIPNPFSKDPAARLYKTGDRARFFENGEIQFLGRLDHQVKLRGFRIELGEIETALENHPAVEQAIATIHDGRIAAYLKTSEPGGSGSTALWENQWDLLYTSAIEQSGGEKLDRLDSVIAGWSGIDNVEAQVTEWIDATVARIRNYHGSSIYEIGCGTGQILARLAPDAEAYWASDISKVAIEALEKSHPQAQVKLLHRPADDFSNIPDFHFDTVVINSVAQYFPDAGYLADVLEKATRALKPGGRIFLGDVQSNALLGVHHAEALAKRAPQGIRIAELREKIAQRLASETELSIDPDWFTHLRAKLPEITHAEIQLRRGKIANETNIYHYDVILHVGGNPPMVTLPASTDWKNLNIEQLEALLLERPEPHFVTGIPDARLAPAIAFQAAISQAAADAPIPAIPAAASNAVAAETLFSLAETLGFSAHVRWQGDGTAGLLDAVFVPVTDGAIPSWPALLPAKPAAAFANTPRQADRPQENQISARLRSHLARNLPEYMIPATFTVMSAFPMTPNGKVDRKALPAPLQAAAVNHEITPPRNETERELVEIWQQVLGRPNIGIDDDIFELGGDSILIFQITTRAQRAGLAVTPAEVFRLRTISAIARDKSSEQSPSSPAASIQRVDRDAYRRKL